MSPNDTKEALGIVRGKISAMSREDLERLAGQALDALAGVALNDFTPDYHYPGGKNRGVVNRNGEMPRDPGSRWLTPRELAAAFAARWSR